MALVNKASKRFDGARPSISLCMIVKDEEKNLAACLNSASGIAGEIIVVDTGSTDRTVEIAESFGARVITSDWPGSFAEARNIGVEQASKDWILALDADEQLDAGSLSAIADATQKAGVEGCTLMFRNYMSDGPSPDVVSHRVCRLFRNKPEYRFSGRIHEVVEPSIAKAGGKVADIDAIVHHYGYRQSEMKERNKHERNVALLKAELRDNPDNPYHLFNLGMSYLTNGDHEESVIYLRKALDNTGSDNKAAPRVTSVLAKALCACGRNADALEVIRSAQRSGIEHPELSYLKGNALLDESIFDEAKNSFEQAVSLSRSADWEGDSAAGGYKAQYGIARARMGLGDYAAAAQAAEKAILEKPDLAEARKLLGEAYLALDQLQQAEIHFTYYGGLRQEAADAYVGLGKVYAAQGRLQEAMNSFSTAVEKDVMCGDAYMCAGDLLYHLCRYKEAADIYQNGLACSPDQAAGFTALANCYFQMGAYDAAMMGYEQALGIDPNYRPALDNFSKVQAVFTKRAA